MSKLRKRLIFVYVLTLLTTGVSQVEALSPGPLVIKSTSVSPAIDGKPDEDCWKKAEKRPLRHYMDKDLSIGGTVALCYDENNLYAAFWLDEPQTEKISAPSVKVNDMRLWNGEVLEWFINPVGEGSDYVQLAWNPAGSHYNMKYSGGGATGSSWEPKWKMASVIGTKGWTSEVVIPFSELGQKVPAVGTMWTINLNRTRQIDDKPEYSAVSPTSGPFHTPSCFLSVWFGKYQEPKDVVMESSGHVQVLMGCWNAMWGYDTMVDARGQLDRALGQENVHIRCVLPIPGAVMIDWPQRYKDLKSYHFVVLTDVPASAFSKGQIDDLCRYVNEGGHIVLMSSMEGRMHHQDERPSWANSAFKELLPLEVPLDPYPSTACRNIESTAQNHPLFKGIPIDKEIFNVHTCLSKLRPGATLIASVSLQEKEIGAPVPFIAEKTTGKGSVINVSVEYCEKARNVKVKDLKNNLFVSQFYAVFWDNMIEYATGRPSRFPAKVTVAAKPSDKENVGLYFDILIDNYGDIFRPGGKLRLKPQVEGKIDFPYEAEVFIESPGIAPIPAGRYSLKDNSTEFEINLPYLDRGVYTLRLDIKKENVLITSERGRFFVALPLLADDEFTITAFIESEWFNQGEILRIAREMKSIGFTGFKWVGGIRYVGEEYLFYNQSRFASRMQEAGLHLRPCWYPTLHYILYKPNDIGKIDTTANLPLPDTAFPGKEFLPWQYFWNNAFGERGYGRMPLTEGYVSADEVIGLTIPAPRLAKGFEAVTGIATPYDSRQPGFYEFMKYRFKVVADVTWFARAVCETYNPSWAFDSVISPNSLAGHSSAVLNVIDTASSLGDTSPDVYNRGYPDLLHLMAVVWSATDFGRLAKAGFTGGWQPYYELFPEQVFASISGGARDFSVFHQGWSTFEKNGRQDQKFAEIFKKTTPVASRIGRTLNHYDRARARVAMLYPHTAHTITSMDMKFNPDYLKMFGTSEQYLDLRFGSQLQFELLRQMAGHVDILFDEQIQRGDLKKYDVCVLAYAKQVEERTLRELRRFIEDGGMLLVTTDSGQFNEHQKDTDTLYNVLPATVGKERSVDTDYSGTLIQKPEEWSTGHELSPKTGAKILFAFQDNVPACVQGKVGRGEAIVLGMPLAGLRTRDNQANYKLLERILNERARLVSRPEHEEFSAITFISKRGDGRIFMVVNHSKDDAKTRVRAYGDQDEAKYTLVDIVTGEKVPFTAKDREMSFDISCPALWGRALALVNEVPASIEVSVSGPATAGEKFMLAVRLLGRDGQLVRNTLPFDLTVKNSEGNIRDDLSGVRVAEQGVYVFAMEWPVAAIKGKWTVTASEKTSGSSDSVTWQAQ